jgi:hypothetical protein
MKWCLVPLLLVLIGFVLSVHAESLWRDSNLFSSRKEVRAGDILKINFAYRNLVRYRNEMKVGETESISLGQPNITTFAFLPSLENNSTHTRNNNLEFNNEREFSTSIAVTVENVNENGIVSFRGGHTIILNGQSEQVILQGQVRWLDVGEGNSVQSTDIANLSFVWRGPQTVRQQALGLDDFTLPANAEANADADAEAGDGVAAAASGDFELTPEARQRLLLQYLNRVHDILFRE